MLGQLPDPRLQAQSSQESLLTAVYCVTACDSASATTAQAREAGQRAGPGPGAGSGEQKAQEHLLCVSGFALGALRVLAAGRLRTETEPGQVAWRAAGAGLGPGLGATPGVAVLREGAVLPLARQWRGCGGWLGGSVAEMGILSAVGLASCTCVMFERKL